MSSTLFQLAALYRRGRNLWDALSYRGLTNLWFGLVWHTLMFQQAAFGPNVDRRKPKREEDGGSKGYRCPGSELASCGAEGESDAAALLLPLPLLQLLSAMCSRFLVAKSPKCTWSRPKQPVSPNERRQTTKSERGTCRTP